MKTIANTYLLFGAAAGFGLAFFGATAIAQTPVGMTPAGMTGTPKFESLVVPIFSAAEQTWAAGSNYKVSFHAGATFVPLLGRDYPGNRQLNWHTESATLGTTELVTTAPRLSHAGRRAEYDLGSIVEAYDVRAEGVEQTFVLTTRLASGDLTIRGRVTTTLHADEMAPKHAGLSFTDDEGRELITYGAATAIDANGKQCAMTTSYREGEVTLRLAGSWLEQAAYPVVVDPMLGSGGWVSGVDPIESLDVCRPSEGSGEQIWVAYSRFASATDGDVYLQRFADDGTPGNLAYNSMFIMGSSEHPSCAYVAATDKVLMAYENYSGFIGSTRRLDVHLHHRNDPNSNTDHLSLGTPINAWKADVGGTQVSGDGPNACIVYQQEATQGTFQESTTSRIFGCLFDTATETHTTPKLLASAFFTDCENPTVGAVCSSGSTNRWVVAWQSYYSLPSWPTWDVQARMFYYNETLSPAADIMSSSSSHELGPKIAGSGDRWLVACAGRGLGLFPIKPTTTNGIQLRAMRLEWPAFANQPTLPHAVATVQSSTTSSIVLGGLAFHRDTDSHWGMTWHDTLADTVHFELVGYRGLPVTSETVGSSPSGGSAAASAVSYNQQNGQFVAAYGINYNAINYVQTNRFEFPHVATASTQGQACSPATIAWQGSQYIGSDRGAITVSGAAADSLHVLAMSTIPAIGHVGGTGPFAPGCLIHIGLNPAHFLGLFPIEVGSTPQWDLQLPESLAADVFYFQDVHTVGNGNLDMVTTQRLVLSIAR